ncbi:hypothetical protein PCASD_10545 [Puccinia coronata f. sp. avenae]|uniref:SWIM-type domain-containing protein n=1 Tax=Puccinia coronata f. sp. avenae TaxID=200324 RepID=A0A2N5UKS1_9BASI|nr:hypothetical protein PCASD_10545 [Puccinia coronata f. sp. avenae]
MAVNSTQSNEMEHSIIAQREQSDFEDIFNHQIDQINSPELTEGQIQAISLLCGSEVLIAALELLDLKLVRRLLAIKNGTMIYEIHGNEAVYHVQIGLRNSCNCKTFLDRVIINSYQLVCSHLLAVKIGTKINSIETQEIN